MRSGPDAAFPGLRSQAGRRSRSSSTSSSAKRYLHHVTGPIACTETSLSDQTLVPACLLLLLLLLLLRPQSSSCFFLSPPLSSFILVFLFLLLFRLLFRLVPADAGPECAAARYAPLSSYAHSRQCPVLTSCVMLLFSRYEYGGTTLLSWQCTEGEYGGAEGEYGGPRAEHEAPSLPPQRRPRPGPFPLLLLPPPLPSLSLSFPLSLPLPLPPSLPPSLSPSLPLPPSLSLPLPLSPLSSLPRSRSACVPHLPPLVLTQSVCTQVPVLAMLPEEPEKEQFILDLY
eukprot:2911801-Rhodomonas_salina.2